MLNLAVTKFLGSCVLASVILVTLFVSPWNSIDPINLPKLSLLGVLAFIASAIALSQNKFLMSQQARPILLTTLTFICLLLINLFVNRSDLSFKFYGTPGRSTGFLAYFSLSLILLVSVLVVSKEFLKKYIFALLGVGALLSLYGVAQWQDLDFIEYRIIYASNVTATLGNPNFQSAYMGMVAAVAVVQVVFSRVNHFLRACFLATASLAILNIRLSSEQGYFNFLSGLLVGLVVFFFMTKRDKLGWSLLCISSVGGFVFILGVFNIGPLADFLYKSSLQARGFYWRAALKMLTENPIFGVGLDGFGDWYRRSRTKEAAQFNAGLVSDSAHSIPLDIASNGGFPLLIAYCAFIGLALIAIVKVVRRSQEFDLLFTSIIAAWAAYQAQSLISINQLGLGVWGWTLTGLLIGYEINTRTATSEAMNKSEKSKKYLAETLPASVILFAFAGGLIGLAVSLPPYLAANKFYKALQSGDGVVIQESAYLKPHDRTRFLYTVQILVENKLEKKAIKVLIDASKLYPDHFELWQKWSTIPSARPSDIQKAKAEMKRLDPFNPDLK